MKGKIEVGAQTAGVKLTIPLAVGSSRPAQF